VLFTIAVRTTSRGEGVARALTTEALRRYAGAPEVVVETFGEDNVQGRPARRLYEAFGFVGCEHLARIRKICEPFPECEESLLQDRPLFRVRTRRFAIFNGNASPPRRRWNDFGRSLHFVTDPQEQDALRQDVRLVTSPHHGDRGWMALDLERGEIDWDEIAGLLEAAYRQVANRHLVEQLDAST